MFNIFRNTSVYLSRDSEFMKFITIMPTVLFLLMSVLLPYSDKHMIGVVNRTGDNGKVYVNALKSIDGFKIYEYSDDELNDKLIGGNVEMAVIIDDSGIMITTLSESEIKDTVETVLNNADSGGQSDSAAYTTNSVPKKTLEIKNLIPFLLFKILTASSLVGALLINERKNKIRDRILISGVGTGKYIMGVSAAYMLFSCAGSVIFFIICEAARFNIGMRNDIGFLLMLFLTNLLSVSICVFASSILKNEEQLWVMGSAILMPMGILSGVLFPYDTMPDTMKSIAKFCPQRWIAAGIERMQDLGSIGAAYREILMILAAAIIFMTCGIIITKQKERKAL